MCVDAIAVECKRHLVWHFVILISGHNYTEMGNLLITHFSSACLLLHYTMCTSSESLFFV